jgi:hypothetical protein
MKTEPLHLSSLARRQGTALILALVAALGAWHRRGRPRPAARESQWHGARVHLA